MELPILGTAERDEVYQALISLNQAVNSEVSLPVFQAINIHPAETESLIEEIQILLRKVQDLVIPEFNIDVNEVALLKSAITLNRKLLAEDVEEKSSRTSSVALRSQIEARLSVVNKMVNTPWFKSVEPRRIPKLTDFLTIQEAENAQNRARDTVLESRSYDEKFGILFAPTLFVPDLQMYRTACGLRGTGIVVAFIDIDDFKSFNTKYGESAVDSNVLPAFMSALEAHIFGRGYSYRQGGDEYLAICPGLSAISAATFFGEFQAKLQELVLHEVVERLEVSIGVCQIDPECPLTDKEVVERAAFAKSHAKELGKNRVAGFRGPNYGDTDVEDLTTI